MKQAVEILPSDHPSFGASQAVFTFALGQGPMRILSVEATNPWAVLCLERILLVDGKVSPNCYVLQVVRDHRDLGTRHDMVQEPTFAEFCLDIVDPDRMFCDAVILEAFKNALSDGEKIQALAKLQAAKNLMDQRAEVLEPFDPFPPSEEIVPQLQGPDQSDKLTAALTGLGFKKTEVRQFVSTLGDRARTDGFHDLLREGLRVLAA
jgi:hypothetical protein